MMVETVAARVTGGVGYPLVGVQRAAFSNGSRPESLPTDEAELLDEASELLSAAEVLQSQAFKLPTRLFGSEPYDAAIKSLVAQRLRLLPVLEIDLFEPIYQQLHMAIQAAGTISGLKQHGQHDVTEAWKRVVPQTDFWAALVWVSREWKRRTKSAIDEKNTQKKLVSSHAVAKFLGINATSLRTKTWPPAKVKGDRRGPSQFIWLQLKPALKKQYPKEPWDDFERSL
ncbi:MAG: hypothetical protein ABGZ53_11790 [Fuerstiella sp.]